MNIWPHFFLASPYKENTVRDFILRGPDSQWIDCPSVTNILSNLTTLYSPVNDEKRWKLTANGKFSVKTFYNFLNDGGMRCPGSPIILKGDCPKKINLFNWLAWDNKILTLENLALRRCNFFHSTTCVMCHANVETADHLLIHCPMALHIWNYFGHLYEARRIPMSLKDLWGGLEENFA